jgi:hypothetical protein
MSRPETRSKRSQRIGASRSTRADFTVLLQARLWLTGTPRSSLPCVCVSYEACWPAILQGAHGVLLVYNPDKPAHEQEVDLWWVVIIIIMTRMIISILLLLLLLLTSIITTIIITITMIRTI